MWRLAFSASVSFACAASLSTTGSAQPPAHSGYVVTLAGDNSLADEAATLQAIAREQMMAHPGLAWQHPDQRFLGYSEDASTALSEAQTAMAEGQGAYLNLQLDGAVTAFKRALAAYRRAAPVLESPEAIGEALLYLGASQVAQGDRRGARQSFRQLARQFPNSRPDPQQFSPAVVDAYRAAARGIPAAGALTVESPAQGTNVYVDYSRRGTAPVTVDGLPAGQHVVRVMRPGFVPEVDNVTLRAGRPSQLTLVPDSGSQTRRWVGLTGRMGTTVLPDELDTDGDAGILASMLQLDLLGLLRVTRAHPGGPLALEFAAFDAATGDRIVHLEEQATAANLSTTGTQLVQRALRVMAEHEPSQAGQQVAVATGERTDSRDDDRDDGSIFEKWYFWAAVGAVAVGGGVATYLLLQDGDDSSDNAQIVIQF